MPYIDVRNVRKIYRKKKLEVPVLDGLDLAVERGEFIALMGPSGSGKTTLLNLLGALDSATAGTIQIGDDQLHTMSDRQRTSWRSRHCGYIFQLYHLMPVLTAAQNVGLPLRLFKMSASERHERVSFALKVVGLEDRADHKPSQLSGGQEQRVAIARALVTDPDLLLADEPTGDLDADSAHEILQLMERLNKEFDKTIIMVTHDQKAAGHASRLVRLEKGKLMSAEAAAAVTY
ncbi:MAG: ABC transporter ATP-binding protein [Phycisphaerales bacterium]|nr:ABC transporter ATP-binding protein [Phycisphaerales bacterium]MCB9854551.1 ABC transporter ATP-binding protein [Phycisphaerales bacterium]MCB9863206.1 ABC transporter ATP-binding protein [Phycisphaerales bacterium]